MKPILKIVLAALLAGAGIFGAENAAFAALINEIEPNNSFGSPQVISSASFTLEANGNIFNSTTLPHVTILGTGDGTADFYQFTTTAPGQIIVDIDSFISPADVVDRTNMDTTLELFDSGGASIAFSDDNGFDAGDGGFANGLNSLISTGILPAGTYTVEVGDFFSGVPQPGGQYAVHISANVAVIPEPATMVLLGFGLGGVAAGYGVMRRRKHKQKARA